MKIVLPIVIFTSLLLSACGGESTESKENKSQMTFCMCADLDDAYENEEDKEFCDKKMSEWKDKLKNGDEEEQQKATKEMEDCI